jgi:hypothetical protein
MTYTRRTHIVRIPDDPDTGNYIDVEVLDAISFKTTDGHDVILSMKAEASDPYIVDDTGGGHERKSGRSSRSHMKRITSKTDPTQQLDIEVADIIALKDTNGRVWVLDMKATTGDGPSLFDSVDGSGDSKASRRVHSEKISVPFGSKDKANTNYLTMQRCDNIAFRTINGQVVVLSSPSADDGSGPRAETFTTPSGYDPSDDSASAVVPPMLKDTGDKRNYVKFVKDASGVFTGDEKIQMGPFWWIRKIAGGQTYLVITVNAHTTSSGGAAPPPPTAGASGDHLIAESVPVTTQTFAPGHPATTSYFFIWPGAATFPTPDTVAESVGLGLAYGGQFSVMLDMNSGGFTFYRVPGSSADGFYTSLDEAAAGAAFQNNKIGTTLAGPYTIEWFAPGATLGPSGWGGFSAGQVDVTDTNSIGSGTATMTQQFLFGPLPAGASLFSVSFGGSKVAGVDVQLIGGVKGTVKDFDTFGGGVTLAGDSGGGRVSSFGVDVFVGAKADGSDSSVVVSILDGGGGVG